jgi:hypothetical protein
MGTESGARLKVRPGQIRQVPELGLVPVGRRPAQDRPLPLLHLVPADHGVVPRGAADAAEASVQPQQYGRAAYPRRGLQVAKDQQVNRADGLLESTS